MRLTLTLVFALILLLVTASCNKQTDGQDSSTGTSTTDATPVADSAADTVPDDGDEVADATADGGADASADSTSEKDDGDSGGEDTDGDGDGGGKESGDRDGNGLVDTELPPIGRDSPTLDVPAFYTKRCSSCHGKKLNGTEIGPQLQNLKQHYNIAQLKSYLKDPAGFSHGNKRLINLGRKYNIVMSNVQLLPHELTALANWLLEH